MQSQTRSAPTILVVEDEPVVAEVIEEALAQAGYLVQATVSTGAEALLAAERLKPDLVLMDIEISGPMDGVETARVMKERHDIPVVFLTAHTDDATLTRALASEPYGYLVKPLQLKEIRTTIEMALYKAGMEQRLRESERKARALLARFEHQAGHDALTGLPNRREFERVAASAWQSALREARQHMLVYIDLDRFKAVNDSGGHQAGDEVLRRTGQAMKRHLRQSDVLARLGGDEFAVLLPDCPPAKAQSIAQQLIDTVSAQRVAWQNKVFAIGASAGVAALTAEHSGFEEALLHADHACARAKQSGRGRVSAVEQTTREDASRARRFVTHEGLNDALSKQQFVLHAQPMSALSARACASNVQTTELLLRMLDGTGGFIGPMAFLPAAERLNLAQDIDRWVLRHCFETIAQAPQRHAQVRYCINLSAASVADELLPSYLEQEAARTGVALDRIGLEVAESVAMSNMVYVQHLMSKLKPRGCVFLLDDFANGVNSFAWLRRLPFDYLKIDESLTRAVAEDPINALLIDAVVKAAAQLNVQTIAECVDDADLLAALRQHGIDYAQGNALSAPQPWPA